MAAPAGEVAVALTGPQRRLLLGVCVVVGAVTVLHATFNYCIAPMLAALGTRESESSLLRQLPSIASLLVVFPAGVLGGRWGGRRLITLGGLLFSAGSAVVLCAPTFGVVCVGLVVQSAGASAVLVTALGLLSAGVDAPTARASALATFAVVTPVVYVVAPVLAGALVEEWGWRSVPAMWLTAGLVLLSATRALVARSEAERTTGELWTPVLAGVTLTFLISAVNSLRYDGVTAWATVATFAALVASGVVVVVVYRRSDAPSLSIASLRRGGSLLLLAVAIIVPFANLWFYMTLGFQYVYGLSLVDTALVLSGAQIAGIAGALVTRRLMIRWGMTRTGVASIGLLIASLLCTLLLGAQSPMWLATMIACGYAVAVTATGIPVTNAIMDTAPTGEEGSASAFRGAAALLGNAVGVLIMSAVLFGAVQSSLSDDLRRDGLPANRSDRIATAMRDGATSESLASAYAVPVTQIDEISDAQSDAMIDGLHAFAIVSTGFTALALVCFLVGRRRQERHDAETGRDGARG